MTGWYDLEILESSQKIFHLSSNGSAHNFKEQTPSFITLWALDGLSMGQDFILFFYLSPTEWLLNTPAWLFRKDFQGGSSSICEKGIPNPRKYPFPSFSFMIIYEIHRIGK